MKLLCVPYLAKAGKLYSRLPESGAGDFEVVRGTTASYVGQDGLIRFAAANEPRFDWTNGCPVLLDEGAATNLIEFSADITNAYWTTDNTAVSISAVQSPAFGQNFGLITESATNSPHSIFAPIVGRGSVGAECTQYCYARPNGRRYLALTFGFDSGNVGYVLYDLQNGVIHSQSSTGAATLTDSFILPSGSNSFLCGLTGSVAGLPNRLFFVNLIDDPAGVLSTGQKVYSGNGTSGIYVWGLDFKQGQFSSHIFTNGAAATRNADVITVTPPAGTSEIVTTFEDGTTQVVTSIPGTFTIPNGRVAKVKMT